MKKSLAAAVALIAGFAIASPIAAWSADEPGAPAASQAAPGEHGMTGGQGTPGPGMTGGMMGMMGHRDMGPMMHRHGMHWMGMHRMGMHGMGMRLPAAQRCEERLARRAAKIAYTVTKLNLTAQQRPLWDKLNAIVQSGTEKEQQLCAGLKPKEQKAERTILERADSREQFLTARLQTLQQARPVLEQFYQALTPEQQAIINHPFRRG